MFHSDSFDDITVQIFSRYYSTNMHKDLIINNDVFDYFC